MIVNIKKITFVVVLLIFGLITWYSINPAKSSAKSSLQSKKNSSLDIEDMFTVYKKVNKNNPEEHLSRLLFSNFIKALYYVSKLDIKSHIILFCLVDNANLYDKNKKVSVKLYITSDVEKALKKNEEFVEEFFSQHDNAINYLADEHFLPKMDQRNGKLVITFSQDVFDFYKNHCIEMISDLLHDSKYSDKFITKDLKEEISKKKWDLNNKKYSLIDVALSHWYCYIKSTKNLKVFNK
ncbi:putative SP-containing protein [Vairimorpha necatrix]|uniref:SP-containing protein n=1 Tax=Vairimorpha necatrix TaxID=6039 RepID=A0AAX4JFQ5_9MICR